MKTIWQFPLEIKPSQIINLPAGSEILCVQMQNSKPTLWAAVDSTNQPTPRTILIVSTGHPLPDALLPTFIYLPNLPYLDTIQSDGFVWHVFLGD